MGEGEMRMQSQLEFASKAVPLSDTSLAALQISSDTDNIALAMMALHQGKFERYNRVIVKLPSRFADIRQLHNCLKSVSLCPLVFVRLYCLCGNDFCCGCSVATPSALLKTFLHYRERIGDLTDVQSTLQLYYLAFLNRRGLCQQLFSMGITFWSSEWKAEARKAIAYHPSTRSTDHLLPHDDDHALQHSRMTWNRVPLLEPVHKKKCTQQLEPRKMGI